VTGSSIPQGYFWNLLLRVVTVHNLRSENRDKSLFGDEATGTFHRLLVRASRDIRAGGGPGALAGVAAPLLLLLLPCLLLVVVGDVLGLVAVVVVLFFDLPLALGLALGFCLPAITVLLRVVLVVGVHLLVTDLRQALLLGPMGGHLGTPIVPDGGENLG